MWTPSTRCPMQVALALRDALGIKTFVETGTAQGDTAFIAAGHFKAVITTEIDAIIETARRHIKGAGNINVIPGDSLEVLPDILRFALDNGRIGLFWLDAHYSGGPTKIGKSECPVIEEIQLIRRANPKHVIFVDDMQIFCTSGAEREAKMAGWSHKPADWPSADEIIAAAKAEGPCFCMIQETCLFIVPPEMESVVKENL